MYIFRYSIVVVVQGMLGKLLRSRVRASSERKEKTDWQDVQGSTLRLLVGGCRFCSKNGV